MQATQSSIASEVIGIRNLSEQFASVQHVDHESEFGYSPGSQMCQQVAKFTWMAGSAGLAHDAGNLLGALRLYSALLAMPGVLQDEYKEYASELRLLSEKSWTMIDRLVNYARNGSRVESAAIVLPEVLERYHGLLSKVAGRKIEIAWDAGGLQPVNVSEEAVERIVTNLVKNAAEATPNDGSILVRVNGLVVDGARHVAMTVSDAGCGMSAATVQSLRVGDIPRAGGRGIGFRVVRELVAISGGCLEIASESGVGTSISMEWPASTEDGVDPVPSGRISEGCERTVLKAGAGWIAC